MKPKIIIGTSIVIALLAGVLLGRLSTPDMFKNLPSWKKLIDYEEIGRSMYVHLDNCVQDYQDGLEISKQISDPFLKKKFLQLNGYVTHMDFPLSKDIWIDNCMYQKEIYNRIGLGLGSSGQTSKLKK